MPRQTYKTQQRERLMSFFEAHPDVYFSAHELAAAVGDAGISLSAVYRNLAAMECAGLIVGQVKPGEQTKRYRAVAHADCVRHLHLACTKCGHIEHLTEMRSSRMGATLLKADGFRLDLSKTVIYGVCRACAQV